ncbi:MAG: EAL domain-containing protein [Proteobacteria bacterium]|nr:EAL domain-containing protein [Pseudomonadota bacterium]
MTDKPDKWVPYLMPAFTLSVAIYLMAGLANPFLAALVIVFCSLFQVWDTRKNHVARLKLHDILTKAPSGIAIVDLNGRVTMANEALADLLGTPADVITEQTVDQVLGADLWKAITSNRELLMGGTPLKIDCPLHKDPKDIWISGFARTVLNRQDRPHAYVVQIVDVTDRRAAKRVMKTFFDNSADLIFLLDEENRIIDANPASTIALSRPAEDLIGAPLASIVKESSRGIIEQAVIDLDLHSSPIEFSSLALNAPTPVTVNGRMERLASGQDRPLSILNCRIDTDHAKSLEALRSSEARFSRIFHSSPDAILIVRQEDGIVLDFNQGFSRLLGYQREDAIGLHEQELNLWVEPEVKARTLELLNQVGQADSHESLLRTQAGEQLIVSVSMRLIEVDGEVCVLCNGHDITQRVEAERARQASEDKFSKIFAHSPDGIVILRQSDGTVMEINETFVAASGFAREELVNMPVGELGIFAHIEDLIATGSLLQEHGHYENQEITFRTRTQEEIPTLVSATTLEIDGEPCIICIAKDVRQLRLTEERLRTSEARFRGTFENAPIGILLTDMDGSIFQVNHFAAELLGRHKDNLPGTAIINLLPEDERSTFEEMLSCVSSGSQQSVRGEFCMVGWAQEQIWTNLHLAIQYGAGGQPLYCIVQIADITEMKRSQDHMTRMAFHDTLTGLANRRLFMDRLTHAIAHAKRGRISGALLYLDLVQFKRVNDTLGHEAGDRLLKIVAQRLADSVREQDTVGRMGGDEFTVLLYELDGPEDAAHVARKILNELRKPMMISGQQLIITTSIGITSIPQDGETPAELLRNADLAMYQAKRNGRDNFQYYQEIMNTSAAVRLETEIQIRQALKNNEFELFYQPKIDVKSQDITGVECLIRWNHPTRGLLTPDAFIDIAEETGIIVEMGNWIIEQACLHAVDLAKAHGGDVAMAVNVSPRQFRDEHLITKVKNALRNAGLDPHQLELEIVETTLIDDVEAAAATLKELNDLGVRVAIDDFGTGYSSLTYLKKFPIDTVKVDRSFVMDIPQNADDMAITSAVIAMAHQLHMQVVAEGVETVEQLKFLAEQKCEFAQGYLFSKPVPFEQVKTLLAPNLRLLHAQVGQGER